MSENANSINPGLGVTYAALHSSGENHRLVVAAGSGSSWRVLEARMLAENELGSVAAVCAQRGVSQLIRIVPTGNCIAKCVEVPVGDASQMSAAAELLAEAELPSLVAPYRRAGGLIPEASRTGLRTALLTGWIARGESPAPIVGHTGSGPSLIETWCTSLAALAMLRGTSGRTAAYIDHAESAVCVLAVGSEKSVARVSLGDAEYGGDLTGAALAMVRETASLAGSLPNADPLPSAGSSRVMLERASRAAVCAQVDGSRDDAAWFDDYGIALGAILAAGDAFAAPLAGLLAKAPIIEEPMPVRTARWISTGSRAWWIGAAALICVVAIPWGLAAARDSMLSKRTKVLDDMKGAKTEVEQKAGLYQQLESSRLPMTKLLADISAATPVDIVATDVHLTAGQGLSAQGSVTIQGTAKSRELVNEFQENLTKTRLFRDVKQPRSESTSEGLVEFTITADIPRGQGHVKVDKPADNFGKTKGKPLVVRMYGEEGAKLIAAGGSAPAGGDDAKKGSRRGDRGDGKDDPAESRKPSSTDTLPPVVTDEDIKKMDKTTATKEWIARKVYVQKTPTLDSSTKQRLQDEEAKIKAHGASLPSASAGGGGGGSGGDKPK